MPSRPHMKRQPLCKDDLSVSCDLSVLGVTKGLDFLLFPGSSPFWDKTRSDPHRERTLLKCPKECGTRRFRCRSF